MKKIAILLAATAFSFNVMAANPGDDKDKSIGDKYCAKMKDGKVVVMHKGEVITTNVTLDDGRIIKPDGAIVEKDGSWTMLKEGQCFSKSGEMKDKGKTDDKLKNKSDDKNSRDNYK